MPLPLQPDSGHRLIVASNRGPVSYLPSGDGWLTQRGGGGLVSAMSSVELDGDQALWICAAMTDDDRAAVAAGAVEDRVRMLDIDRDRFEAAYDDVSNSTLWFVHHMLFDLRFEPVFTHSFGRRWLEYQAYNAAFAEAIDEEAAHGATVLIQDYHLSLVPSLLRMRRPDLKSAYFAHTPWAPPEYLGVLPREAMEQLLVGVLGADHTGFHSHRWAKDFVDCCVDLLGAQAWREGDRWMVRHHHRATRVDVHPLGVDADLFLEGLERIEVEAHLIRMREKYGDRAVIARIDRTEPSKNILRGLIAYREFLRQRPEWHGRVVHFVLAYYSRQDLVAYQSYTQSVRDLCEEINAEFGTDDWQPIDLYLEADMDLAMAAYALADVMVVNPVRDGMNLVAKESAVVSNHVDHGIVLVLSRNAGAADELGEYALLVNPFDIEEMAQMLHTALLMDRDERRRRTYLMAQISGALPPSSWVRRQIDALAHDVILIEERSPQRL
jgi:trehalose 6-phosphate synthase